MDGAVEGRNDARLGGGVGGGRDGGGGAAGAGCAGGCGWRVHRRERGKRGSAGLGGFKGAEKLASDVDLTHGVAKDGTGAGVTVVRQERLGSWEMGMTRGKVGEGEGRAEGEGGAEGEGQGERVRSGAHYGRSAEEEEDEVHVSPHADPVKIDDRV